MTKVEYRNKEGTGPPRKLTDIVQRCNELIDAATPAYVDRGTDFMLDAMKAAMPESHDPAVEGYEYVPGGDGVHMRDEAHRTDVHVDGDVWHAEAGTDKSYAPYVDEGTGLYGPKHSKYLIVPRDPHGALRFPWGGRIVFASHVWHPGSPGAHFMEKSRRVTLSREGVRVWRIEGDEIFKRGMQDR